MKLSHFHFLQGADRFSDMWRWVLLISAVAAQECNISPSLVEEIRGYQGVIDEIINAVVDGKYSNVFYNNLANFTDTFGNRLTGKL